MQIKSEWDLLNSIKGFITKKGIAAPSDLLESIGDDCAVFRINDNKLGLITTDISIESVHFRRDLSSLEDIGFKAMMGNISDIAAMGGKAKFAFVSIGIPEGLAEDDVLSVYEGLVEAGNMADVVLAGGDTSKAKEMVLNIALYGETLKNKLVRRKGARSGDIIYVTGELGGSMAGLEILLAKKQIKQFTGLASKHKRPNARFDIVDEIIAEFNPSSMIDISDGLLSDLRHICESSNAGFKLIEDRLPVSNELCNYSDSIKRSCFEYALKSGEEYELLFTSVKKSTEQVEIGKKKIRVTPIGEIIDNGFYIFKDNKELKIPISGYDHFMKNKGLH